MKPIVALPPTLVHCLLVVFSGPCDPFDLCLTCLMVVRWEVLIGRIPMMSMSRISNRALLTAILEHPMHSLNGEVK